MALFLFAHTALLGKQCMCERGLNVVHKMGNYHVITHLKKCIFNITLKVSSWFFTIIDLDKRIVNGDHDPLLKILNRYVKAGKKGGSASEQVRFRKTVTPEDYCKMGKTKLQCCIFGGKTPEMTWK